RQFNKSLYEVLMFTFANADKNQVFSNLDSIREAWINLMTNDKEFIDSIEISTNTVKATRTRFDKWRMELESIIESGTKEPRCFSTHLKEELYESDPTCAICKQHISGIDDAALDHVKQYWKGGKTIPENARLTHRYCNWARSRKE
ncbi:MAG: HNH endonuclease signature motif containing protein, partial [Methanobacteriaceae archaeon]|nr:HNH endonuclease signature motif containing protein [Methanobacteriaceae archaeon]